MQTPNSQKIIGTIEILLGIVILSTTAFYLYKFQSKNINLLPVYLISISLLSSGIGFMVYGYCHFRNILRLYMISKQKIDKIKCEMCGIPFIIVIFISWSVIAYLYSPSKYYTYLWFSVIPIYVYYFSKVIREYKQIKNSRPTNG